MNNNIYVVDEDDNIVGKSTYEEFDYNRDFFRVSTLWVVDMAGQNILIAQRSLDNWVDAGKWGPSVAGMVDLGESYRDNIIKEAGEEIGLSDIDPIELYKIKIDLPDRHFHNQIYGIRTDWSIEKFVKQDEEVEALKFVNIDELAVDTRLNPGKYVLEKFADEVDKLKQAIAEGKI